ncbi:G-protein beta WD-40 repeats containing protein [Reticulomyxa filosa]|uniref:G-protein beta WD-40 repeats containing protein n=1 Tax=Reticulomyxa filosa TaxID=46433 RepID=X6P6K9_RETFI|nr:G-protein beta WD-40 repeats containing protein [Reticulomyxa filosa]|eukprot:ETO33724.1 G-protein beta WD-40 repeats containing protein [Reticulomyxa filosa]
MGNRTTAQKSTERQAKQTEQSQHLITPTSFQHLTDLPATLSERQSEPLVTPFQTLKALPIPLEESQCVLHKHEIIICGGKDERACYSYHTIKNEYKFICEYPSDVELARHCVVELANNNSKDRHEITLLSFGGFRKHTLMMKYVSIWSNENNKSKELNNYNEWIPFTDNHNHPIIIGRDIDNYSGLRAVIGGRNNNLLFITYYYRNISVFDLNTFQFIKHDTLPTNNAIYCHCFVSKSANEQGQERMNTNEEENKRSYQMLLFCDCTGLSIEYNEDNNAFQFHQLPVCDDIAPLFRYAYVCVNGAILFFGGCNDGNGTNSVVSKSVYKYLIRENKWMIFENFLPSSLVNCVAVLSEEDNDIHIIGGRDDERRTVLTHLKARVCVWNAPQLSTNEIKCIIQYWVRVLKIKLGWIDEFNKIVIDYAKVKGYQLLMVLQGHDIAVSSVRFSADGRKIVSASYDRTVRIWDVSSGKQLQIFRGHTSAVFTARFSPDEHTVASCSKDGTIRLWDVNTGTEIIKIEKKFGPIWDIDFSPDGRYIVSGFRDKTIRLWDIHSGIEINRLLGHSAGVLSTQFSSDGKMILSSSIDKIINLWNVESVRIWNIETGIELKILKEYLNTVNDIQYFPDCQTIVSCSRDRTVRLWNVESAKIIQILNGKSDVKCVDVSQNGNKIIVGSSDCKIQILGLLYP